MKIHVYPRGLNVSAGMRHFMAVCCTPWGARAAVRRLQQKEVPTFTEAWFARASREQKDVGKLYRAELLVKL